MGISSPIPFSNGNTPVTGGSASSNRKEGGAVAPAEDPFELNRAPSI
jgi:hypothetical protein